MRAAGRLAALLALLALPALAARPGSPPAAAQAARPRPPEGARLLGWGGYGAVAPENTLAAIRAAAEAGFPRVWLDVRLTGDGVPVLLRDADLARTTDCTGPVSGKTAAIVTACDAGARFDPAFAGETVPRLADALVIPGLEVVLELGAGPAAPVAAAVAAAGAQDRVRYVAAEPDLLASLAPGVPMGRLWLRAGDLSRRTLQGLVAAGFGGLVLDAPGLQAVDGPSLAGLRAAGLGLDAAPVTDERDLFSAMALGADHMAVDRLVPLERALGLAFRTYTAPAFGLAPRSPQALARALAAGDFDGDARADLAIGAPLDGAVEAAAGWVGVSFGSATFPGRLYTEAGTERDGEWGAVLSAADWNDDGTDDLAIGYPLRDFTGGNSGAIWLWDGSASGLGRLTRPVGPRGDPGAHLGEAIAAGDFDGDGVLDMAVSAPDTGLQNQQAAGRVWLLPGQAGSGPVTTGQLVFDRADPEVPRDALPRERLGAALAMGDFNADGFDDLAMGGPGGGTESVQQAGTVLIAFGAPDDEFDGESRFQGVVELERGLPEIPGDAERGGQFGAALAAADLDGDGVDDLAIGAPGASVDGVRTAGEVIVAFGHPGMVTEGEEDPMDPMLRLPAELTLGRAAVYNQSSGAIPGDPSSRAAWGSRLGAADLDGDGRADLLVGSAESVDRLAGSGSLTVLYGGPGGPQSRVALRLAPGMAPLALPPAGDLAFGESFTVADLNGDGARDLAIGAPGRAVDGLSRAGTLLVAWGYDPLLPGVPTPTAPPPTPSPTEYPTEAVTPSITPTPGPTASPTARPTETVRPRPVYLPMLIRYQAFPGRYPTPGPAGVYDWVRREGRFSAAGDLEGEIEAMARRSARARYAFNEWCRCSEKTRRGGAVSLRA